MISNYPMKLMKSSTLMVITLMITLPKRFSIEDGIYIWRKDRHICYIVVMFLHDFLYPMIVLT